MPEEGYLSGIILQASGDSLELEDFAGKRWAVIAKDIDIVPAVKMEPGEKIKIIGRMVSRERFNAKKIRPWGTEDRMKGNHQKK
jgi:hypothetical protein